MGASHLVKTKRTMTDERANVTFMLLWSIRPKIDWNQLLPTIESKNVVSIMIVSNSASDIGASAMFTGG